NTQNICVCTSRFSLPLTEGFKLERKRNSESFAYSSSFSILIHFLPNCSPLIYLGGNLLAHDQHQQALCPCENRTFPIFSSEVLLVDSDVVGEAALHRCDNAAL